MNDLVKEIHEEAISKGWWEKPRLLREVLMLVITEISEASEAVRNGEPPVYGIQEGSHPTSIRISDPSYIAAHKLKPEGEAVELVDAFIRIADYFGFRKWELEKYARSPNTVANEIDEAERPLTVHFQITQAVVAASGVTTAQKLGEAVTLIQQYFAIRGWNFDEVVRLKLDYNKTRSYRHGRKVL